MRIHDAVKLMPPNPDARVEIDKRIAGLIKECWRLGLITTHCCEGNVVDARAAHEGVPTHPDLAYISFADWKHAMMFAAAAGPFAWNNKTHRQRAREAPEQVNRWTSDWRLEGRVVRFPARDIPRAQAQLRTYGVRLCADSGSVDPRECAPKLCPSCGSPVMSRRRDARYCSRRCQLGARAGRRVKR